MAKVIKVETLAIFKLSAVDHDRNTRPQMFHRGTALKHFTKIRKNTKDGAVFSIMSQATPLFFSSACL